MKKRNEKELTRSNRDGWLDVFQKNAAHTPISRATDKRKGLLWILTTLVLSRRTQGSVKNEERGGRWQS